MPRLRPRVNDGDHHLRPRVNHGPDYKGPGKAYIISWIVLAVIAIAYALLH